MNDPKNEWMRGGTRTSCRFGEIFIGKRILCVGLIGALLTIMGCASNHATGSEGLVIGVVDPQRILEETQKGQALTDQLNAFMKNRKTLIDLEQQELRELESELMAQRSVLSTEGRGRKEEKFRQKMAAFQNKVADLNREVQEKQQELHENFRQVVQKVVEDIANQKNIGMVIEHGAKTGTLFFRPNWDISSEVIQALNERGDD